MDAKKITNNALSFLFIAFMIFYILYTKGIILADFNFLSPQQAVEILANEDDNVTIIDVRSMQEYKSLGYIKNAILIPLETLENRLEELQKSKNKKIFVYCASGNRSIAASRILDANGFYTYNINGGINNWKSSGFTIEK